MAEPRGATSRLSARSRLLLRLTVTMTDETFKHHTGPVISLALLPDGLRVVSGSWDKTARIAYHGLAP